MVDRSRCAWRRGEAGDPGVADRVAGAHERIEPLRLGPAGNDRAGARHAGPRHDCGHVVGSSCRQDRDPAAAADAAAEVIELSEGDLDGDDIASVTELLETWADDPVSQRSCGAPRGSLLAISLPCWRRCRPPQRPDDSRSGAPALARHAARHVDDRLTGRFLGDPRPHPSAPWSHRCSSVAHLACSPRGSRGAHRRAPQPHRRYEPARVQDGGLTDGVCRSCCGRGEPGCRRSRSLGKELPARL